MACKAIYNRFGLIWSSEADDFVRRLAGTMSWEDIAQQLGNRTGQETEARWKYITRVDKEMAQPRAAARERARKRHVINQARYRRKWEERKHQ